MSSVRVVITGAAGRIAYSLIPLVLRGDVFGTAVAIDLVLLDIPDASEKLHGIVLEISDSNYPLLKSLVATTSAEEAFRNVQVAILLGGFPRLPGMERRDLLRKNAESMKIQAVALNQYADRNVKVVVVANPANTNCLVAIKSAPNIPAENFTCLTRLDEERLRNFCLKKVADSTPGLNMRGAQVKDVFVFGNHSNTQVAYINQGKVALNDGRLLNISNYFTEEEHETMLKRVQGRGAEIIKSLQLSSAMSAAEAIVKHLHDWLGPATHEDHYTTEEVKGTVAPSNSFSMGVYAKDGSHYGIHEELVYSLPCVRSLSQDCGYAIRDDLTLSPRIVELMNASMQELVQEKKEIEDYLM